MVAVQVALTLLMLTAAGAAGKGFLRLANADLGYDPQNTMSLPIPVHDGTYPTWKERSEYFERLRASDRRDAASGVGRDFDQRDTAVEWRRQPPRNTWEQRAGEARRPGQFHQLGVFSAPAHSGGAGATVER